MDPTFLWCMEKYLRCQISDLDFRLQKFLWPILSLCFLFSCITFQIWTFVHLLPILDNYLLYFLCILYMTFFVKSLFLLLLHYISDLDFYKFAPYFTSLFVVLFVHFSMSLHWCIDFFSTSFFLNSPTKFLHKSGRHVFLHSFKFILS